MYARGWPAVESAVAGAVVADSCIRSAASAAHGRDGLRANLRRIPARLAPIQPARHRRFLPSKIPSPLALVGLPKCAAKSKAVVPKASARCATLTTASVVVTGPTLRLPVPFGPVSEFYKTCCFGALVNGCETTACLRSLFTNVHNPQ